MTSQDYIDLLPIVSGQTWSEDIFDGRIRNEKGQCPLCALAEEIRPELQFTVSYYDATLGADLLPDQLRLSAIHQVANAADRKEHPKHRALKLALGMK